MRKKRIICIIIICSSCLSIKCQTVILFRLISLSHEKFKIDVDFQFQNCSNWSNTHQVKMKWFYLLLSFLFAVFVSSAELKTGFDRYMYFIFWLKNHFLLIPFQIIYFIFFYISIVNLCDEQQDDDMIDCVVSQIKYSIQNLKKNIQKFDALKTSVSD